MASVNLQVRIPKALAEQIEQLAPTSKSEFVRNALLEKIRKERNCRRENEWIRALKKHPEDAREAGKWLSVETWDDD